MSPNDTDASRSLVRVRAVASDNVALLLAVLAVLAVAGGFLTYATHVDPGTTVETREGASWESTGEFTHRATVTNATAAFEQGSVLRNRSAYVTAVAPTLEGSFAYSYVASDGGNLTADASTSLVIRSVAESDAEETTEYWRVERPLATEDVDSLAPGESATVPFSLNVSAASERATRLERQHGHTPGETRLTLLARVELTGTRNGEPVDLTRRYRLPISPDGGVYAVDDAGPTTLDGRATERVTVPASPGPVGRLGAPALFLVAATALVATAVARWRGVLSVPEWKRSLAAHERTRGEFDEWITSGTVPRSARGDHSIEIDSLEGVVDVAIDTNERVIEDTAHGEYVVLDGATTYVYRPPAAVRSSLVSGTAADADPEDGVSLQQEAAEPDDTDPILVDGDAAADDHGVGAAPTKSSSDGGVPEGRDGDGSESED